MRNQYKRIVGKDGRAVNIFDIGHTSIRVTDAQARELFGQMQAEWGRGINGRGAKIANGHR